MKIKAVKSSINKKLYKTTENLIISLSLKTNQRIASEAADSFGVEIDREVERDMGHARFQRFCIAVRIDSIRRGQDRRHRRFSRRSGGWRRVAGIARRECKHRRESRGLEERLHDCSCVPGPAVPA